MVLAETFREVMAKDGKLQELEHLSNKSTLYSAMFKNLRNCKDYPSDLKMLKNDKKIIHELSMLYKDMYLDALTTSW